MIRIRVIGNSQVAAIKHGWDAIADDYPQVALEFFSAHGKIFRQFDLDPTTHQFGLLAPDTIGGDIQQIIKKRNGALTVPLSDCDHIMVVGHIQGHLELYELLAHFSVDGLNPNPARQPMSSLAFEAILDGIAKANLPVWNFKNLDPIPVTFIPPARIAESVCNSTSDRKQHVLVRNALSWPTGLAKGLELLDQMVEKALTERGVDYFAQPVETFAASGLTQDIYRHSAQGINGQSFNDTDYNHMNADFGALVLREVLDPIVPSSVPPSPAPWKVSRKKALKGRFTQASKKKAGS